MKITASNRMIKNKARTLAEFKCVVKDARLKAEAIVTLRDKKRNVFSGNMRIGSYIDAYELCRLSEISLVSYQAVFVEHPKAVRLLTKAEYDKI